VDTTHRNRGSDKQIEIYSAKFVTDLQLALTFNNVCNITLPSFGLNTHCIFTPRRERAENDCLNVTLSHCCESLQVTGNEILPESSMFCKTLKGHRKSEKTCVAIVFHRYLVSVRYCFIECAVY
jgi:hypothetical protein